ncbi:MAG: hypothetical protein JWO17_2158 [Actinomycetia bacterium]|nr:hypothetical protein [Actinomycetes bacterium]
MARMLAVPHPYPDDGASAWIATARPGQDFATVLRERRFAKLSDTESPVSVLSAMTPVSDTSWVGWDNVLSPEAVP